MGVTGFILELSREMQQKTTLRCNEKRQNDYGDWYPRYEYLFIAASNHFYILYGSIQIGKNCRFLLHIP